LPDYHPTPCTASMCCFRARPDRQPRFNRYSPFAMLSFSFLHLVLNDFHRSQCTDDSPFVISSSHAYLDSLWTLSTMNAPLRHNLIIFANNVSTKLSNASFLHQLRTTSILLLPICYRTNENAILTPHFYACLLLHRLILFRTMFWTQSPSFRRLVTPSTIFPIHHRFLSRP
jgi:hypothetical protein